MNDWISAVLLMFFTIVALFMILLIIGVRAVRKFSRWLFSPFFTTPTRRR